MNYNVKVRFHTVGWRHSLSNEQKSADDAYVFNFHWFCWSNVYHLQITYSVEVKCTAIGIIKNLKSDKWYIKSPDSSSCMGPIPGFPKTQII